MNVITTLNYVVFALFLTAFLFRAFRTKRILDWLFCLGIGVLLVAQIAQDWTNPYHRVINSESLTVLGLLVASGAIMITTEIRERRKT